VGNSPSTHLGHSGLLLPPGAVGRKQRHRGPNRKTRFSLLAAAVLQTAFAFAQGAPRVTSVMPSSGKVNDSVTLTGVNLGKGSVSDVFLSDDKDDYKATIVEQADQRIVMKVPQVKPGNYNVSVEAADKILIMPVRFTVQ